MARVGGLEPPGPVLETGSVATSLTPSFSKTNKKSRPGSGSGAIARMHSDPQDTTPQMTRFVVIQAMPRLEILKDTSIHPSVTANHLWSVRQDSNLRALRS